jgi:signal transduction histidine kinase
VTVAQRNTHRLILIINGILELDRLSNIILMSDNAATQFTVTIDNANQSIEGYCNYHNVIVDAGTLVDDLVPDIDPNRIVQVLTN